MAAGTYDIVIDQGSDFALEIQMQENDAYVNLATHTARAQLRPTPTSNTLTASFTCTVPDAANGKIKMTLSYADTANIAAGKYYYDLEVENTFSNTVSRLLQGVARVTPEVTR
jgi:hypothetical protein